ncbi:MAG: hypothetical protein JW915_09240 [Chitinispirillaceae bacterium]|nr:hypothetical protein [Chitinispirillaceae bacterium]
MNHTNRKDLIDELRVLAGIAQEREKEEDVATLLKQFEEWKRKFSDDIDLENIISATHDIIDKNRWKEYIRDNEFIVIRALYKTIITEEDMSPELYSSLKPKIDAVKKVLGR